MRALEIPPLGIVPPPSAFAAPDIGAAPEGIPLAAWARAVRPSAIQEMMGLMGRPGMISFALGLPAPELFPVEEYLAAAGRVLRSDLGALQYRPGFAPLREEIARLMDRRGVRCTPEQVFLTTAAQQGLALVTRLLLEDGGPVICDELVYMGFQQVVEPYRPRLLTVSSDLATGMDVDAVEAHLCAGPRPAFIYCVTDGHNPLGTSLSMEKRERLVELARRYRVPILEDDAYGLLGFEPPLPPLRGLDEDWVLYVGSFSKVLAPGFRVGWVVAPPEMMPLLGCAKDGLDIDTSTFSQRVVAEYLAGGDFPRHLGAVRSEYRTRRDLMLELLAELFPAGTRWSVPRNGALIWAELPEGLDAGELLRPALQAGVAYVPGSAFTARGGEAGRRCLRLNFSFSPPEQIREGMTRLGEIFRAAAAGGVPAPTPGG